MFSKVKMSDPLPPYEIVASPGRVWVYSLNFKVTLPGLVPPEPVLSSIKVFCPSIALKVPEVPIPVRVLVSVPTAILFVVVFPLSVTLSNVKLFELD